MPDERAMVQTNAMERGKKLDTSKLFEDEPYGRVTRVRYERVTVYLLFTSEHTDLDALTEMWKLLPDGISYQETESWPYGFGELAKRCQVTTMTRRRGAVPIASKEKLFTTQVVRLLR